jgi:iturin family lipopeptide synthetase A
VNGRLEDLGPDALLSRVTELGVLLRAEGDSLCYDAPSAVATPELLTALRRHRASLLSRIKTEVVRRAPVTSQERRAITAHQQHPMPQVLNVVVRITFRGPLNVTALCAALSALVARHESLRTRYVLADDEWWQEVLRPRPVDLGVHDLTTLRCDAREAEIERIGARLADAPFDLQAGPEPVFRLLRAGDLRWVLLFVLHHVSCDAWGLSVLLKDFAALYAAAAAGRPDGLERPMQPTEYALWQREGPVAGERRLAYWSRQLQGARFDVDLPTDRPRPPAVSGQGEVVLFRVPAEVRRQIEAYARRHGTTPYAITAAAFGLLLSRLSGQQDIVFSVPYANREHRAHENLVASVAVGFPLRIRMAEAKTFPALVETVARDTTSAISNIMSMSEIVAGTGNEDLARGLEIGFQYQNTLETEIEFPGLTVAIEELAPSAARKEFSIGLIPIGDLFSGYVEYSTDLWNRETMEQWADAYRELLREIVTSTETSRVHGGNLPCHGELCHGELLC